jgi:hypothetical protein
MVKPREQLLGSITVLDENSGGSVNASGAELSNVTVVLNSRASAPTTGTGKGAFWVDDDSPTTPKFTDSAGNTISFNIVSSVFGRTGDIISVDDDYTSTQITNLSSVSGANVSEALDTLAATIPMVSVVSVFGRTGAVTASVGDYSTSLINNSSSIPGTTLTTALNNLNLSQVLALGSNTGTHWIDVNTGYGIRGETAASFTVKGGAATATAGGTLTIAGGESSLGAGGAVNISGGSAPNGAGGSVLISSGTGLTTGTIAFNIGSVEKVSMNSTTLSSLLTLDMLNQ